MRYDSCSNKKLRVFQQLSNVVLSKTTVMKFRLKILTFSETLEVITVFVMFYPRFHKSSLLDCLCLCVQSFLLSSVCTGENCPASRSGRTTNSSPATGKSSLWLSVEKPLRLRKFCIFTCVWEFSLGFHLSTCLRCEAVCYQVYDVESLELKLLSNGLVFFNLFFSLCDCGLSSYAGF